jgi:hypothetical protein
VSRYELSVLQLQVNMWKIETWMQERISHCQMSFFIIGCVLSFTCLFILKMIGLGTVECALATLAVVVVMTILAGVMRQKKSVIIYIHGESIVSFIGAILCVLAFLMGAIK